MTKTKVTKRALLSSVLALLLCVSMLIGTTYAWFTDSVTSAGNIIKSGKLDVEMKWAEADTDPDDTVTSGTNAAAGPIFDYELWEPGYVAARHVSIANVGTLAFKYQIRIVVNGELEQNANGHTLADVIDVYYLDPAQQIDDRADLDGLTPIPLADFLAANATAANTAQGVLVPADKATPSLKSKETVTIALKMRESAGNEYQDMTLGASFSIQLLATQYTFEADSFNDQYDAQAEYPVVSTSSVTMTDTATAALEIQSIGEIKSASVPAAAANTVFAAMKDAEAESNELTLTLNVTKTGEVTTTAGTTVALEIDMTAVMEKTKAGVTTTTTNDVTTFSDYVTINYNLGTGKAVTGVTHSGVAMVNSANITDDAGKGIYSYDASTGILTIMTKTFSPFAVTYRMPTGRTATIPTVEETWRKDKKFVLPCDKTVLPGAAGQAVAASSEDEFNTYYNKAKAFVDEAEQYFTPNEADRTIAISTAEGLQHLYWISAYCSAKNAMACKDMDGSPYSAWYYATLFEPAREFTVIVTQDIDLGGSIDNKGVITNNWTPTACGIKVDFQNHKVSNLVSDTYVDDSSGLFASCAGIRNLVLENVTILEYSGNKETGAGAIAGSAMGDLIDCTVRNAKITATKWAGALSAFTYSSVKNCAVENAQVTSGYKLGGLCGQSSTASDDHPYKDYINNQLTNVSLICDLSLSGKSQANIGQLFGYLQNNANIYSNTFSGQVNPTSAAATDTTATSGLVGVLQSEFAINTQAE